MTKNNDIQCLRALAIILVIAQHYRNRLPTPEWYALLFRHFGFWSGVDIFFAVSGFLICKTFLHDLDQANSFPVAAKRFWLRRAIRLMPALVFWSGFSVALTLITMSAVEADTLKVLISAAISLIGLSNVYWSHCFQTDISACGNPDFNGITWSLSLEWQLYALLTMLLYVLGRRFAIILMLGFSLIMSTLQAHAFSYAWSFRMQAFTLGALIFIISSKDCRFRALHVSLISSRIMLLSGMLLCIMAPKSVPQPFVLPAIALGAAFCLVSALNGDSYSKSRLARPFIWIGERSYSVYLCHLPLILITREIMSRTMGLQATDANMLTAIFISGSLISISSAISYRLIEQYFQKVFGKPKFPVPVDENAPEAANASASP